jgi:hypothetical protein
MVLLSGSTSAGAQKLFTSERDCAADVSSFCSGYGLSLAMDTGTALQIAALIGAASTITVTFLATSQQRASFLAPAVTSAAARASAWAGAIFLYLIAINYIGGAVLIAINRNGAYEDFGAVAFPVLVGGVFMVTSIWATGRILARWPSSAPHAIRPSSALIQRMARRVCKGFVEIASDQSASTHPASKNSRFRPRWRYARSGPHKLT